MNDLVIAALWCTAALCVAAGAWWWLISRKKKDDNDAATVHDDTKRFRDALKDDTTEEARREHVAMNIHGTTTGRISSIQHEHGHVPRTWAPPKPPPQHWPQNITPVHPVPEHIGKRKSEDEQRHDT